MAAGRIIAGAAAWALIAALAACGGDVTGPAAVAGEYRLVSAGGIGLPATIYQDGYLKESITAGHLSVASDGSSHASITMHYVAGANAPTDSTSYAIWLYTMSGNTLHFTNQSNGVTWDATFSGGNTLTMDATGSYALVFRK